MKNIHISVLDKEIKPNSTSRYITRSIGIFLVLLAVVLILTWNAAELNSVLGRSTEDYVKDVTSHLASDISYRLTSRGMYIEQLADSLGRMPEILVTEEFLDKKAKALNFDSIIILEQNGTTIPGGTYYEHFDDWRKENSTYYDVSKITYINGEKILFSSPVLKDGLANRLLIGVVKNERMQELLMSASFDGHGLSCIADKEGKVVVAPTDIKPFLQINDIISKGENEKEREAVNKMMDDISNSHSGMLYFTSFTHKTPLIMSYHFLGVNDWILLTIVPQNLIIDGSDAYIKRTFFIIGGIAVIFVLILASIVLNNKKNRKQLERLAFIDPLTEGINNMVFKINCRSLLNQNPSSAYSMVYINIRGFKYINENFGTEAGDKTLKYIYTVLNRHVKADELVTRIEADHYFLFLHENTEEQIRLRLREIADDINSFQQKNVQYTINLAQGAYIIEDPNLDIRIMKDHARVACRYQTKEDICAFYNYELTMKMNQEVELNTIFDSSIQNHDFQVYLQPKVHLADHKLCGAEALVRWEHPERGIIYPSDFIPLFEANGKICQLDLYMFEEICKLLHRWEKEGKMLFPISVNLSRMHIRNSNFLKTFTEIKEKYQIADGMIEFELTESVFFDDQQIKLVKNIIQDMHKQGFRCSLDDFGSGFSSLSLLKEFDIDTVKLDRQFFVDDADEKSWKIVSSFISLAHELGISVVAEGIETEAQLSYLLQKNCDIVQGYLYSKPLPVSGFESWADSFDNRDDRGDAN